MTPKKSKSPNKRIGKKNPNLGECCKLMVLVLTRGVLSKGRQASGLEITTWIGEIGTGLSVIMHFPRSKTRGEEHADATYALVRFCPFCGAKVDGGAK